MASEESTTKLPDDPEDGKDTIVTSVRMPPEDEKMVRRAAVELDLTRSEFMAIAAVERAKEVLQDRKAS